MTVRTFLDGKKWGIRMYRGLWNFINRYMDEGHAVSVFLPVMIAGWTVAGVAAGVIGCMFFGMDIMKSMAEIVCAGGYAGIILGLFGGAFFLYRQDL